MLTWGHSDFLPLSLSISAWEVHLNLLMDNGAEFSQDISIFCAILFHLPLQHHLSQPPPPRVSGTMLHFGFSVGSATSGTELDVLDFLYSCVAQKMFMLSTQNCLQMRELFHS